MFRIFIWDYSWLVRVIYSLAYWLQPSGVHHMLSGYFNSDSFFKHILIDIDSSNIQLSSKVFFFNYLGNWTSTSISTSTLFALFRWINLTHREYKVFFTEMYYSANIKILINGKSREDVHSGQRSLGFRVGHCKLSTWRPREMFILVNSSNSLLTVQW